MAVPLQHYRIVVMKRAKAQQVAETPEEQPPKKVRKVKAAVPPPAPRPKVETALLGSLPLYGEELPDGGYDNIPTAARSACAELRDVLSKIRDVKDVQGSDSKVSTI